MKMLLLNSYSLSISKERQIIGLDLHVYQQFFSMWRGVGIAHMSTDYGHVYD